MTGDIDSQSDEQNKDAPEKIPADDAPAAEVDNVGDLSVEINVAELVAKIESADSEVSDEERAIRKKLDEVRSNQKADLDSTYNFNLDDDL